jgi:methylenetetrahydrofolate dehydrogenase (NADP+)/methenyltetrahydrofolate cyclohydrolase
MILSGKPVAEKILTETKECMAVASVVPGLGVVLVGNDPASRVYVGIKESRASELGFRFIKTELPVSATEVEILAAIRRLNEDESIHGIIVQLPLPAHIDANRVISAIDPAKDADGFLFTLHPAKAGSSTQRGEQDKEVSAPVFPEAMIELAKSSGVSFSGKSGVVLVNSERFGKTMADALRQEGVSVEYIILSSRARLAGVAIQERKKENHSGLPRSNAALELAITEKEKIQTADFVFTALGRPETLSRNMFKKDAVVIDGGIAKQDGKIVGDVSVEGNDDGISLSLVPGGVGPVTVACLLRRVAMLALENGKTVV